MNYIQKLKNKKGFTLIELLVVIAIIGLLATLAVVALNNARTKSRDAKRVSDIRQIQTALELYFVDNNSYPSGSSLALGTDTDCNSGNTACTVISSGGGISHSAGASGTTYMGLIPGDPSYTSSSADCDGSGDAAGCSYAYTQTGSGTGYDIWFYLEGATGGLSAGSNCASENGIASSCP